MGNGASAGSSQLTLLDGGGEAGAGLTSPGATTNSSTNNAAGMGINNSAGGGGGGGMNAHHHQDGVGGIQELLPQLKARLIDKDAQVGQYQLALEETQAMLREKDAEIDKLRNEIHKLKSVLAATVHKDGKPDILSTIHEEAAMAGQEARTKKQGVSGESSNAGGPSMELKHFDKDFR